jgi:hypothetical protein
MMQSHRFVAEIWSPDSPKIQIVSTSWRSPVEQVRLDRAYSGFIAELHHRLAAAGTAQFSIGLPAATYWIGVAAFTVLMISIAVMVVRSGLAMQWTGAALVAAFLLIFAYQLGNYFRHNRPRRYRPDAIPSGVLPRA